MYAVDAVELYQFGACAESVRHRPWQSHHMFLHTAAPRAAFCLSRLFVGSAQVRVALPMPEKNRWGPRGSNFPPAAPIWASAQTILLSNRL